MIREGATILKTYIAIKGITLDTFVAMCNEKLDGAHHYELTKKDLKTCMSNGFGTDEAEKVLFLISECEFPW